MLALTGPGDNQMTTYAISAPRQIRALYYAWEYGTRGAVRLLAREPKGQAPVRVIGGTAYRTNGLFRTKRDAQRDFVRVIAMASQMAGKIGHCVRDINFVEIVPAQRDSLAAVADVRPLAQ